MSRVTFVMSQTYQFVDLRTRAKVLNPLVWGNSPISSYGQKLDLTAREKLPKLMLFGYILFDNTLFKYHYVVR